MENDNDFSSSISTGINFDKYFDIPVTVDGRNPPGKVSSIQEAGVHPLIQQNVSRAGYTNLTPIQKHSLPIILAGRDLVGVAQTGSGKTAAFLLPIIHHLVAGNVTQTDIGHLRAPFCLVVTPTRELALQIHAEATRFSHQSKLRTALAYGGISAGVQLSAMQNGCHILVATPGRLLDYNEQGLVSFRCVKFLVLDEADRMLDMGFMPDVQRIVNNPEMPAKGTRQTMMFSATFPQAIRNVAAEFLYDFLFLAVGMVGGACTDVAQDFYYVEQKDRFNKLAEILQADPNEKTLVFLRTKRKTHRMAKQMKKRGFYCGCIHGDRSQAQREQALMEFRTNRCPILLATAVVSRGLDIPGVSHVINFDLPGDVEEYVHRIGRTGRVGNTGRATSFYERNTDLEIAKGLVVMLSQCGQSTPDWLQEEASVTATKRVIKENRKGAVKVEKAAIKAYAAPVMPVMMSQAKASGNPIMPLYDLTSKNAVMMVNELSNKLDWIFLSESGPYTGPGSFTWNVSLGEFSAVGQGNNKKDAKMNAAENLLAQLPENIYIGKRNKQPMAQRSNVENSAASQNSLNKPAPSVQNLSQNAASTPSLAGQASTSNLFDSLLSVINTKNTGPPVRAGPVKNSAMTLNEVSMKTGGDLRWDFSETLKGPRHKTFNCRVSLGEYSAEGSGTNKKIAKALASDNLVGVLPQNLLPKSMTTSIKPTPENDKIISLQGFTDKTENPVVATNVQLPATSSNGDKDKQTLQTKPEFHSIQPLLSVKTNPNNTPINSNGVGSVNGTLPSQENQSSVKNSLMTLNELSMKTGQELAWNFLSEAGPPHMKTFIWRATLGEFTAEGDGSTKKVAKTAAADKLLSLIPQEFIDNTNNHGHKRMFNNAKNGHGKKLKT